jgi:hypothetical protein
LRRWPGQHRRDRGATAAVPAFRRYPEPKAASCKSLLQRSHARPETSALADGRATSPSDAGAAREECDNHNQDIEHICAAIR